MEDQEPAIMGSYVLQEILIGEGYEDSEESWQEAIKRGWIEVGVPDEDGEVMFRFTDEGVDVITEWSKKILNESEDNNE